MSTQEFEVGSRVVHRLFGEGLVVDVRKGALHDVLEVVFPCGVKRIVSTYPLVDPVVQVPASEQGRDTGEASVSPEGDKKEALTAQALAEELAAVAGREWRSTELLEWDESCHGILEKHSRGEFDTSEEFSLRMEAERFALDKGFTQLVAFQGVRDVDRHEHQIRACLKVARDLGGRALLADEVGLGKTIEAGLILKEYLIRHLVRRALILVPVSLLAQWKEELWNKFMLEATIASGPKDWDKGDIVVASIDSAKSAKNRERVRQQTFDVLIVDEAHRLRNHKTLAWKFVHSLDVKYVLLLTATPVQNDLRELFNLVTLLRPGTLGTYRAFRRQFMVRGDRRLAKNTHSLSRLLSEVMVRTSRSQAEVPFTKRVVQSVAFELSEPERVLYDAVAELVRELMGSRRTEIEKQWYFTLLVLQKEIGSSSFAALRTLERICSSARYRAARSRFQALYDMANSIKFNSKCDGLLSILEQRKEKVIVFTQFRSTLDYLKDVLEERGELVSVFHGNLSPGEKEGAIANFKRYGQVLLSTEAGGEGRNLQFCRRVINYDLPWNPMRIEQRIGRVHRLGQKQDIHIFNFTTENTVESYVLEILHKKISMFELVVGEMDLILGSLDDKHSFEEMVFHIWATSRDNEEVRRRFSSFGARLLYAKKRYERVKDLDRSIFDVETERKTE
ncbi:MAG: DEAD/DEAH box helicase family protein [Candidatus Eiseniibacteriota bacterium]|nr:MAG: DEAD/DEAH box helicase family protein [Candidatus Eisenbacteria bacterium]